ncbi:MAG: alpha/beta hydrolase [Pikeienuella sp.]
MSAADRPTAVIHRAGPARAARAVVLLHGRGGGASDILRLGAAVAPAETALFAPEAPGRSWWPTSFLAPMPTLALYLAAALDAVDRTLAAAWDEGHRREQVLLVGFSQGACLALEYAARRGEGLGGLAGLSGGLIGTADAPGDPRPDLYGFTPKRFDYEGRLDGLPVYLSCHAEDPHIPRIRVAETAQRLQALGASIDTVIHPGPGHGITAADLTALRALCAR